MESRVLRLTDRHSSSQPAGSPSVTRPLYVVILFQEDIGRDPTEGASASQMQEVLSISISVSLHRST